MLQAKPNTRVLVTYRPLRNETGLESRTRRLLNVHNETNGERVCMRKWCVYMICITCTLVTSNQDWVAGNKAGRREIWVDSIRVKNEWAVT